MTDDLTFEPPIDLSDDLLPYNYVPAAFGTWASPPLAKSRVLIALPDPDSPQPRQAAKYYILSAETQNNPSALGKIMLDLADGETAPHRCLFGPPSLSGRADADAAFNLAFDPLEPDNGPRPTQIAIIIDIGIAFWNDRFRGPDAPRFKGMWFLDFDAPAAGKSALTLLDAAAVDAMCRLAGQPGGTDKVTTALAQDFPGSWYGQSGGAPDALWHGTAMADLMAGLPPGTADTTALFGIELPLELLRDADGDTLSVVLPLMIEAAISLTHGFTDIPLVIMLPWGFSAGPQDGSHPAAQAVARVLDRARASVDPAVPGRDIKLLLPAGNQLQDRCCAHLMPVAAADPEQTVRWRLPPDDFSQNAVEVIVTPSVPPSVTQKARIAPPTGAPFVAALKQRQAVLIRRGPDLVGLLIRFRDTAATATIPSRPRLRLVLAPTGWQPDGLRPAPSGDWTLSFAATDEVRLWVLRDDRDWRLDGPFPRRASSLLDTDYQDKDSLGNYPLTDDPDSVVVRSGTLSLLASVRGVMAVEAREHLIGHDPGQAWYSGRKTDGTVPAENALVDQDRRSSGVSAAANGSNHRIRVSGTSAAVALRARALLAL